MNSRMGWWKVVAVAAWLCLQAADSEAASPSAPAGLASSASASVRTMHRWVLQARDNEGAPFAIIDKRSARLWVFDAAGRPQGSTPVLLGWARGDRSVPGIGDRPMADIRPHERTTPAGRFIAERGLNLDGEEVFWIDYDAAVSMHRVRASKTTERRLQRLATPTAADNRISYGCINVPVAFFEKVIDPLFASPRPVVYLLPETMPADSLFTPVINLARRPGGADTKR